MTLQAATTVAQDFSPYNSSFNCTISDIIQENSTISQEYNAAEKYIWVAGGSILLLVGTIGNVLALLVLCQPGMRKQKASVYLIVVAVTDLAVLYTGLLRQIILWAFNVDVRHNSELGCKLHTTLVYFFLDFSDWVLAALALERAISVRWTLAVMRRCNRLTSLAVIGGIAVFLFAVNSPFLFILGDFTVTRGYCSRTFPCMSQSKEVHIFITTFWPWIDLAIFALIPLSVHIVCNVVIIRGVTTSFKKAGRCSGSMADESDRRSHRNVASAITGHDVSSFGTPGGSRGFLAGDCGRGSGVSHASGSVGTRQSSGADIAEVSGRSGVASTSAVSYRVFGSSRSGVYSSSTGGIYSSPSGGAYSSNSGVYSSSSGGVYSSPSDGVHSSPNGGVCGSPSTSHRNNADRLPGHPHQSFSCEGGEGRECPDMASSGRTTDHHSSNSSHVGGDGCPAVTSSSPTVCGLRDSLCETYFVHTDDSDGPSGMSLALTNPVLQSPSHTHFADNGGGRDIPSTSAVSARVCDSAGETNSALSCDTCECTGRILTPTDETRVTDSSCVNISRNSDDINGISGAISTSIDSKRLDASSSGTISRNLDEIRGFSGTVSASVVSANLSSSSCGTVSKSPDHINGCSTAVSTSTEQEKTSDSPCETSSLDRDSVRTGGCSSVVSDGSSGIMVSTSTRNDDVNDHLCETSFTYCDKVATGECSGNSSAVIDSGTVEGNKNGKGRTNISSSSSKNNNRCISTASTTMIINSNNDNNSSSSSSSNSADTSTAATTSSNNNTTTNRTSIFNTITITINNNNNNTNSITNSTTTTNNNNNNGNNTTTTTNNNNSGNTNDTTNSSGNNTNTTIMTITTTSNNTNNNNTNNTNTDSSTRSTTYQTPPITLFTPTTRRHAIRRKPAEVELRRKERSEGEGRLLSMTWMLVVVSVVFCLTTLPISLHTIIHGTISYVPEYDGVVYAALNILMYTNNTVNFILYSLSSSMFQAEVRTMCKALRRKCRSCRSRSEGSRPNGNASRPSSRHLSQRPKRRSSLRSFWRKGLVWRTASSKSYALKERPSSSSSVTSFEGSFFKSSGTSGCTLTSSTTMTSGYSLKSSELS